MILKAYLPLLLAIGGCAFNGQRVGYRPEVMTDAQRDVAVYRAEAKYMTSGIVTDDRLNHINKESRIILEPSPGYETLHEKGHETLTSMPSGGYFAFITQVPVTRFFTVVRRFDCEEWGSMIQLNPMRLRNNPELYLGSNEFVGDKPHFACLAEFDAKFAAKDPRLSDTDGVIFDALSARVLPEEQHWSLVTNMVKMHLDGWSIRFKDPSAVDIEKVLSSIPSKGYPLHLLQFKTAIHWIRKSHATAYLGDLIALLPTIDASRDPTIWLEEDELVLETIARLAPETTPEDLWWGVLGYDETDGSQQRRVSRRTGIAPTIAANVLFCRASGNQEAVKRLMTVLREAITSQQQSAAGTALRSMGYTNEVKKLGGPVGTFEWRSKTEGSLFSCPYKAGHHAP